MSDECYTPKWIFDAMDIEFDLDVSAPPGGVSWIPANNYFTKDDDALIQPWKGRVWCNPPFSCSTAFVKKFVEHKNGVMLCGVGKSKAALELWDTADGIVMIKTPKFVRPDGSENDIFLAIWIAAYGKECAEAISRLGKVR